MTSSTRSLASSPAPTARSEPRSRSPASTGRARRASMPPRWTGTAFAGCRVARACPCFRASARARFGTRE
ncbi:MAG: hypothetical protein AMJ63_08535 [Myxococcales bacterium SG8_38_1]|nr:MAG: hypothetical protein AMJ63_08535 [Myxococcales bacterium SG8_38_1]